MAVNIEAQVRRLVGVYSRAIDQLVTRFIGQGDLYGPRMESLVTQSIRELESLRRYTTKWGTFNIEALYAETQKKLGGWVSKAVEGDVAYRPGFDMLNARAVEAMLADPETGFLSSMNKAIDSVKDGIWKIQNQAKLLRAQQAAINETIARVGILEGQSIAKVRRELVQEILSGKPVSELTWMPKVKGLGNDHIIGKMAQLPYVKFSDGKGQMRLDRYCDMVARTKSRQAVTTARRYKLLEIGKELVRISNNLPLQDDACMLYIGKAYALTERAAREHAVPHVKQLPNGGTPFHPNCTHNEMPYFPEYDRSGDTRAAFEKTPTWALDRTWSEVQREYVRRGGAKASLQWNRNAQSAQVTGGRIRRGTPPLEFDLPPEPEPGAESRARVSSRDTRSSRGGGDERWVSRVNEQIDRYGGIVSTPSQATRIGAIAGSQIEREIMGRAGGYGKEHAAALAQIAQLNALVSKAVGARNIIELTKIQQAAVVAALGKMASTVKAQVESWAALASVRGDVTKEYASKVRPLGAKSLPFVAGTDKAAAAVVQDAGAYLPAAWLKKLSTSPLRVTSLGSRAAFGKGGGKAPPTILVTPTEAKAQQKAAALHALVHAAEENLPELRAVEAAYYRKRQEASGEKVFRWLGYPYGRDEIGIRDRWKDRYLGKWYGGDKFELMAVGMQALMGLGDPYLSYRLSHDRDFMRFALGCLLGV